MNDASRLPRGTRFVSGRVALAIVAGALSGCGDSSPGETVGRTEAAITFPNDQTAYEYFVDKGLSRAQAAGIVGNLDQESGVDPAAVESGGPGRGIAQWSVGGRWDTSPDDNATAYAASEGQSLLSLQLQLDFIWYELTTFSEYGLAALRATTNVDDATVAFETDFERCGACEESQRIAYAENVLNAFAPSPVDADADDDESPCIVTTTGASGECLETSACSALADHVSTPGYCPGAANIQCCTGPRLAEAGVVTDSGKGGASDKDGGEASSSETSGSGCSTGASRPGSSWEAISLAILALVIRRRRVRSNAAVRTSPFAPHLQCSRPESDVYRRVPLRGGCGKPED